MKMLMFLKYLIQMKADINSKTENGFTPLYAAVQFGNLETVKYLIEHGANINYTPPSGTTLLHAAAASKPEKLETIKYLM